MVHANRPLVVVYVCDDLSSGGSQEVLVRNVESFDPAVIAATVCTLRSANQYERRLRAAGVSVVSLDLDGDKRGSAIAIIRGIYRLALLLRRVRPDILHSQNQESDLIGGIAGMLAGIRVMMSTCHGPDAFRVLPHVASVRYRVRMALENAVAARWKSIVAVSYSTAAFLRETRDIPASHIVVLRNGRKEVRPSRTKAPDPRPGLHGPTVAFVGRLAAEKNVGLLMRAWCAAKKEVPDLQLMIVGDGPMRSWMTSFAGTQGMSDDVFFLGYQQDVTQYLSLCDMLFLPSFLEGLPLVVLEALCCGVPTVATRVGGTAEAIEDGITGRLVDPPDVQQLVPILRGAEPDSLPDDPAVIRQAAAAIVDLARRTKEQRERDAQCCRDTCERWPSAASVAFQLQELYVRLCAAQGASQ